MERKKTKEIAVGNLRIGGNHPIVIQSMTNVPTEQIEKMLEQIGCLYEAGCQLVRVTVPHEAAAHALHELCRRSPLPLVADIHFDYKLALQAVEAGIAKIRINPGNIGEDSKVRAVADACRKVGIPIRIGVNGGSLEKNVLARFGGPTPEAMVESANYHISLLEKFDFTNLCISLKSSSVSDTIQAYRLMSEQSQYPLHLGVTEAGTERMGLIKSAAGIGGLLAMGIGDTIRVSLTADPIKEVEAAKDILKAVDRNTGGVTVISCPTCGRTQIDLIPMVNEVERRLAHVPQKLTVAVMGCAVNGPGEASHADYGLAGGQGEGLLFQKGKVVGKFPQQQLVDKLLELILTQE